MGRSTDEILKQIYYECDEDIDKAQNSIVVLDEIDKIAFNKENASGDISTIGVQNELLKIIEGCKRIIEIDDGMDDFSIDTSNIIFIGSGAFQELYEHKKQTIGFSRDKDTKTEEKKKITNEDLVAYGLKKELVGRLPIKVELNALTREIMREIILESDESELLAHVEFLNSLGVTVVNLEDIIELIIDDAMKKEIGARGLVETISKLFLKIIYEVANNPRKYSEVKIGLDILNNPLDFELIENNSKKRKRQPKKNQGK